MQTKSCSCDTNKLVSDNVFNSPHHTTPHLTTPHHTTPHHTTPHRTSPHHSSCYSLNSDRAVLVPSRHLLYILTLHLPLQHRILAWLPKLAYHAKKTDKRMPLHRVQGSSWMACKTVCNGVSRPLHISESASVSAGTCRPQQTTCGTQTRALGAQTS